MARTFVMAVTALLPAAFVLVTDVIRDRSAVPGSLGATLGVVPGSLSIVIGGWALLAGLALLLGAAMRHPQIVERGTSAVPAASPRLGAALAIAGAAALALALVASQR